MLAAQTLYAPARPALFDSPAALTARSAGDATAVAHSIRLGLMDGLEYGLFRSPARKPLAFRALSALAARLHRDRAGAPIEAVTMPLGLPGDPHTRLMVGVWTLADGQRRRFLGYAWLGGGAGQRERLQAALLAQQPARFGAYPADQAA